MPVILFAVQRGDAGSVGTADDIDPHYGEELRRVTSLGVEALAYRFIVSTEGVKLGEALPVIP